MNHISPLLNRNVSSKNSMIPPSVGKQVPNNPAELMSQLRSFERRASRSTAVRRENNASSRTLQQEQKREMIERVLMQNEDAAKYNQNEVKRASPAEERIRMEEEDMLSLQLAAHYREAAKLDFREKIRREVEERQRQEQAEKEAKRKAAEDRRAAVVARIRKQQEEEERKLREIKEAAEREVREAEMRLQRNRDGMSEEDELSRQAEQYRAEEEERQQWLAAQAERLRIWEEEQRRKDELEASARAVRLAELEAKKKKLAELQNKQTAAGGAATLSVAAAREEALKLSKQVKMQNKAKFVSKKRQNAPSANASSNEISKTLEPPTPLSITTEISLEQQDIKEHMLPPVPEEIRIKIDSLSGEKDLHAMQRELMANKRELRMQLRTAQTANDEAKSTSLQKNVDEVSSIECYLQQRIQVIQPKTNNESSERRHSLQQQHIAATENGNKSSSDVRNATSAPTDNSLYVEVEKCIRDVNATISRDYDESSADDENQRRLGLLQLQLADLLNRLSDADDIIGYQEKLRVASIKLSAYLEKNKSAAKSPLPPKLHIPSSDVEQPSLRRSSSVKVTAIPPPPEEGSVASGTPQKSLHSLPTPKAKEQTSTAAHAASPVINTEVPPLSPPSSLTSSSIYSSAINSSLNYSESSKSTDVFMALSSRSPMATKETTHLPSLSEANGATKHETSESQANNITNDLGDEVTYIADHDVIDDEPDESSYINYEDIEGWNECLYTTMATAAHHAAFYGYTGVLEVLSRYFDVFVMDKNGRTPLFYACLRNNLDCVLLLIGIDAQWVDVGDYRGDTALHATAIADGVAVLEFLLSCEVQPDVANNEGLTCSHLAKSCRALTLLHEAGAMLYCVDSHSRMPLWYACKDGRPDCVEYLCSKMPQEFIMWGDEEGNTPLHVACSQGNSECVDVICRWVKKLEDLSALNSKQYSAAHVAVNAAVLQKLFEHGVNLWSPDAKGRYPLFMSSFHGYVDCVALLMELGMYQDVSLISAKDKQGDTVLHVACLCGHMPCASLLLYFLRDEPNNQGLTPSLLAERAGHHHIASLVRNVESSRAQGLSGEDIFQCMLEDLSAVILYHGSRWDKLYDASSQAVYYYDRVLGTSQWERPISFDGDAKEEIATDSARDALIRFFSIYSPQRLHKINEIINMYRNRYTELFIELATRYKIPDISIFTNVAQ